VDWEGADLIRWLYARCGQSEEDNRAIKEDFAGGNIPFFIQGARYMLQEESE